MNMMDRVDPELKKLLKDYLELTAGGVRLHDIPAIRKISNQMATAMKAQAPDIPGVTEEDLQIPGPANAPEVNIRIYRPSGSSKKLPALLWMHGGGYVLGNMDQDDPTSKSMAINSECVVVSVEYRLAPENPFPAPIEDCYAALKWLASHGERIGVNPALIAVGGASAGGGLSAALALLARDRAEVRITFQLLIYPMIDDHNVTLTGKSVSDSFVWTRENNLIGWRSYLGCEPGAEEISPYAAVFRAKELSGLPPAYIAVGDLDLFLNENIEYARRLLGAGVPVELHVYPGAFHGFYNFFPLAQISRRFTADLENALKRAYRRDAHT
jgi:acetyl esterase/lipase